MFTGLVEEVGRVERIDVLPSGKGRRLVVSAKLLAEEMPLGASLATDGVCLTVTAWRPGKVEMEVGPESLSRTTLGALTIGGEVNLERPLRLGDRLGGHLVSGHVDGVGRIARVTPRGEAVDMTIEAPDALLRYVVEKGSITVDGISLTVNAVDAHSFSVSLIPHTQAVTSLSRKAAASAVNLEVDLIGKYVEKLCGGFSRKTGGLSLETLKEHGYVDK